MGPDGNVDVGQWRGPAVDDGSGPGAGGRIHGCRRRFPGPAGTRRLVPGLLHGAGRSRRFGGDARGAGRRLRRRGATVPSRQSHQPDPRRRLSRLRRQPEHGAPGKPGQHTGDAGQGAAPVVLGGGDLRHLAGPELDRITAPAAAPLARDLAVHPPDFARCRAIRAERPADVLRRQPHGQPRLPRRERRGALVPVRQGLRGQRRHHRVPPGPGRRVDLHGRFTGEHRHPRATQGGRPFLHAPSRGGAAGRAVAARLPARARAGPRRDGTRHHDLRQGAVAHRLDRRTHALLTGHPATPTWRRHRRRVSLRQPCRLLRADLHLAGGDAALPRHPRPRGRGVRAGGLRPDHRPVPGARQRRPRLGAGVVPRLRLAELRPDGGGTAHRTEPGLDGPARRGLGSAARPTRTCGGRAGGGRPGCPCGPLAPVPAGDVGGGGGTPSRTPRAPGGLSAPDGRDSGGVCGPTRCADRETGRRRGAGWPRRWKRARTGATTRRRRQRAMVQEARRGARVRPRRSGQAVPPPAPETPVPVGSGARG